MRNNIRLKEKLFSIVASVFSVSSADTIENLRAGEIEKWDSLGHLKLFLTIENEMSIKFTTEEIISLLSVKEILEKIYDRAGDE